jgi:hypothetical protein
MTNLESVASLIGCFIVGARFGWWARGKRGEFGQRPSVATHIRTLEPPEVIDFQRRREAPKV